MTGTDLRFNIQDAEEIFWFVYALASPLRIRFLQLLACWGGLYINEIAEKLEQELGGAF